MLELKIPSRHLVSKGRFEISDCFGQVGSHVTRDVFGVVYGGDDVWGRAVDVA